MASEPQLVLDAGSVSCDQLLAGGKARNLWLLGQLVGCPVPSWFVLTTRAFTRFIEVCYHAVCLYASGSFSYLQHNKLAHSLSIDPSDLAGSTATIHDLIMAGSWPDDLRAVLQEHLTATPFADSFVAVRSEWY